jgi:hypothetical protein
MPEVIQESPFERMNRLENEMNRPEPWQTRGGEEPQKEEATTNTKTIEEMGYRETPLSEEHIDAATGIYRALRQADSQISWDGIAQQLQEIYRGTVFTGDAVQQAVVKRLNTPPGL